MEMTDRQPRPHSTPMWVLMVIVTVIALIIGAVGESVLEPPVAQAVSTAKVRVVDAVDALTARTTAVLSGSAPKAQSKASANPAAATQTQTKPVNSTAATQRPLQASVAEPYVAVVKEAGPAVVTVVNQMPPQATFFGQVAQPTALGSGVIIDKQGHIVTNNHVVQGGGQFQVIFSDGRKVPARLIGRDSLSDVAVLQVDGPVPAVATFGDSSAIQTGERVVAIGSALGDFRNTVTHGIISGVDRTLPDSSGPSLSGLIQTDAPINHGNSGGPLLNMHGQVIGINTAVVRGSGIGGDVAEGLGFAIPSNTVTKIAQELIKNGYVIQPYLGVNWQPVNPQIAAYYGLEVNSGALIAAVVPGSPASKAGLQPGDVVTAVDGTTIDEQHDFAALLLNHKIGDTVRLTVRRGHQNLTLNATLGQRPQTTQ
jgi:2-alkenal reductase